MEVMQSIDRSLNGSGPASEGRDGAIWKSHTTYREHKND